MQPDPRFTDLPQTFWANVRTISQVLGYTSRVTKQFKVHNAHDIVAAYESLNLATDHLFDSRYRPTDFGLALLDYFEYRADILTTAAEPNLMDWEEAKQEFENLRLAINPQRRFQMNKQKGEKAGPALLTGIVNMILESKLGDDCDYDPQQLTTVTRDGLPVRTLARRVDGAYPAVINPIAVWEIKEYYFTTTFGSRVADGVYETMLDGLELQELRQEEDIDVKHYMMIDSHYTWWSTSGKPFLCRMVDMLHMGLVDEVLFGREVITRLPGLIDEWLVLRQRGFAEDQGGQPEIVVRVR